MHAQDKLYPNTFPLGDVTLLDGPFKSARDLNIHTLLQYNVDRCLAPYLKVSGLTPKANNYPNWESIGLDGHIAGHYLSAMAMNYAATGNSDCKQRMDYMISELKACQDANTANNSAWGVNYIGGVSNSSTIWSTFKTGDFSAYRSAWVPWYNLHKIYAGLRDAWMYAGNEDAKTIFLKFCDWGMDITSGLTDTQMESMLDTEHGGMNEIFADAYQMTGNDKYLTAAKRFSHKALLDAMAGGNDNLDNKHANTQIPKAVGFQRIAELNGDNTYAKAASFFWETVTGNRSLAFGGNSRKEHFPSAAACGDYIDEVDGPESCNTYNMLKLSEFLFRADPLAQYADFYERALYNHILSTQHPEHGGYVYFTPARPRHYRVYSAPNLAMWCCVGTGMENHGKYNQFIYTHVNDSLFLNLFIPSELNWKAEGIKIRQETGFPSEERTQLTVTEGSARFRLMIRYPSWVADGCLKVVVDGDTVSYSAGPSSYVPVDRFWTAGDEVEILLPMQNTNSEINLYLMVRFWGNESGTRRFDILINDEKFKTVNISGVWNVLDFKNVVYRIPDSKIEGKDTIRVKFQAPANGYAGGVFNLRLLRREDATDIQVGKNQPGFFKLYQSYPNPFNPSTLISYRLPASVFVILKVYDVLGKEVRTLVSERQDAGNHSVQFNALNLSSGVYFYTIKAGVFNDAGKLLLFK